VYVAENTLEALLEELIFILRLPITTEMLPLLRIELKTYRSLAGAFHAANPLPPNPPAPVPPVAGAPPVNRPPPSGALQWKFWRTHYPSLPSWYKFAAEAALIATSSCAVERIFALCEALFDDTQTGALADYRTASVMIRYNTGWRDSYPL
jgi:hypothetical protein